MKFLVLLFALMFMSIIKNSFGQIQLKNPKNEKPVNNVWADTTKLDDGGIVHVWLNNGWINAERIDKYNSLMWRTVIAKSNGKDLPKISKKWDKVKISSADGKYFITAQIRSLSLFPYEILRGVQEKAVNDISANFNPNLYGITPVARIAANEEGTLVTCEKDGWKYISISSSENGGVVGIFRTRFDLMDNQMKGMRSSVGLEINDEHHFFWDGNIIYAEQVPTGFVDSLIAKTNLLLDKPAPELVSAEWYNKKDFSSLSELKGKVILLYFWATWCYPCLRNMPFLETYQAKYEDKGLIVIGVHHNKGTDKIEKYLSDYPNIQFPICAGTQEIINSYSMQLDLPKYFLIGRNGKVIKMFLDKIPSESDLIKILAK